MNDKEKLLSMSPDDPAMVAMITGLPVEIQQDIADVRDERRRAMTYMLGGSIVIGSAISLAIVFLALKKQPWWVKLLVFIVINPPITGLSALITFGGAALVSPKLSDAGQDAVARINDFNAKLQEPAPAPQELTADGRPIETF